MVPRGWSPPETLDALGPSLADLTFVVVDLETSGGSPDGDAITEVAAVKVRGGEVLGELHTLVAPDHPIAPFVSELTGITDDLLAGAPPISAVLPSLLEFCRGAVLVAHNAGFDVSFLRSACSRHSQEWPDPPVLDTVALARRVLAADDDVPDCRLSTLAEVFHARCTPSHRALDDARATVDVLHGLFERVGCEGVTTFDELRSYSARISPVQRRKRHLADTVPPVSGVYLQLDARDHVVHVGLAPDLHAEIRRQVTSSSLPRRLLDRLAATERIEARPCTTLLEAYALVVRLAAAAGQPVRRDRFGAPTPGPDRAARAKLRAADQVLAIDHAPLTQDEARRWTPDAQAVVVAVIRRGRLHGAAVATGPTARQVAAALVQSAKSEAPGVQILHNRQLRKVRT